jgi:hypothetical protein
MRTERRHAIRRGLQYLAEHRLVHLPPALDDPQAHSLAGQGTRNEYRFAVDARDAPAVVRECDDFRGYDRTRFHSAAQAAANSCK